jgi:hypothetical protein
MKASEHLNEDELIQAVTDEMDLPETVREHLRNCIECMKERALFDKELLTIGQLAKTLSPLPQRKINIALPHTDRANPWWHMLLNPACAVSVLLLCVITAVFLMSPLQRYEQYKTAQFFEEIKADEALLAEAAEAEHTYLDDFYPKLSNTDYSNVDETFFDFIVPLNENGNST